MFTSVLIGIPRSSAISKEERLDIEALQEQVGKLKSQLSAAVGKIATLTEQLEKKKREVEMLKKTAYLGKRPPGGAKAEPPTELLVLPGGNPHLEPSSTGKSSRPVDPSLLEVAKRQKAHIAALEEELRALRMETSRSTKSLLPPAKSGDADAQLRDATWKLQQLQAQYDYLVAKTSSQSESNRYEKDHLEDAQRRVHELRRALEDLKREKELSDSKAAKVDNLEDLVAELRQANRSLEDKIARLCEAPFIKTAFGAHQERSRVEELIADNQNLSTQVAHLQEAVRTHFSALNTLKQQAAQLREEKELSDKLAEELKLKLGDLEVGKDELNDKLRLYAGDDGLDVETLEKALTMVKRRNTAVGKLPFLEDPENESLVTLPSLKRKLEEYQLLNLRLTEENERLENMLKLQSNINKDLHKELEALVLARDKDKSEMQKKAQDFEQIALARLDKIHSLEAQLRQYVYGLSKKTKQKSLFSISEGKESELNIDQDDGTDLLAQLVGDTDGQMQPDDNLLEVWIKCATIKEGILTAGSSSFVVADFFDYESQTTPLVSGTKPQWDFAATYKLTVDDFLLRYLATDAVTFELNMVSRIMFNYFPRKA